MNDVKPNFSKRALDGLQNIKFQNNIPPVMTIDMYLHPELMLSYLERRKQVHAEISESTSK